jgi:hypothetical protein
MRSFNVDEVLLLNRSRSHTSHHQEENKVTFRKIGQDRTIRVESDPLVYTIMIALFKFLVLLLGFSSVAGDCTNGCNVNGRCVNGECVCDNGFAGADCSFPYQTCPDGILTCYDGAQCTRLSMRLDGERSEYQCDCSTVSEASPFQIKECESPESEACVQGQETSDYAFCTNGGKCKNQIQYGEPHAGCTCPDEFEGRHCQYRKGTAPDSELKFAFEEEEHHIEGFFLFLIILIVGFFLGGFGYIAYKRKMSSTRLITQEELEETTKDIALEECDNTEETPKGEMA